MLESTLTDSVFDLNYIALNAGGELQAGDDVLTTEEVTVGAGGSITVTKTPVAFGGTTTIYGWVKPVVGNTWTTLTFTGSTATSTFTQGDKVCVKYAYNNTGMKYFTVPTSIIPSICHMYMTYPLFAGGTSEDVSSKTQVGELVIDIPKFQFNGTFDMSLTSSGAATSNLSGQALASYASASCDDLSQYATIKLNLFDTTWYDELEGMLIEDAEFTLAPNATKTLKVYGVYSGGAVGYIDNSLLEFSSQGGSASVNANTGVVTAGASASATATYIEAKPKQVSGGSTRPAGVAGYAEVTVQ